MMKHPWRSKTILVNIWILALSFWAERSSVYVDPQWFVVAIVTVNIVLRCVTRHGLSLRKVGARVPSGS